MSLPGRDWPPGDHDPMAAARGVLLALVISLPLWIVIGLLWWLR